MFFDDSFNIDDDEKMDYFNASISSCTSFTYDSEINEHLYISGSKIFESESEVDYEDFEEICELSKLETLKINVREIDCGESLEKLKNLKKLTLSNLLQKYEQSFFTFKLDSLETLDIAQCELIQNPEILEIISSNFQNLKVLKLESSQKLNFFAKTFPKLEKLFLEFDELWEFDTGIVNENLTELNIKSFFNFCEIGELFFELFETFPNLDTLKIDINDCFDEHHHFTDANFFGKLIKKEKLKSIDLELLELSLEKNNLKKIEGNLIELAKRLKFVRINFTDEKEEDRDSINSKYETFLNEIKKYYKTVEHYSSYYGETFRFNLLISTEKKE